jgi:hypothetical protein
MEVESEIREGNIGTHVYYLSNLVKELGKIDSYNAGKFQKYFNVFKRQRNEADYYKIEIDFSKINEARSKAEKIRMFLTNTCEHGDCQNIYKF